MGGRISTRKYGSHRSYVIILFPTAMVFFLSRQGALRLELQTSGWFLSYIPCCQLSHIDPELTHSYQVRGFCKFKSNPEVFDVVNVYGNIYDSDIHHNHFGMYTYGHQQGDWRRNKMHDNTAYGFDPHDDSDFLTIHDNDVYNNVKHGIIASKRCNGVSIQVCWLGNLGRLTFLIAFVSDIDRCRATFRNYGAQRSQRDMPYLLGTNLF